MASGSLRISAHFAPVYQSARAICREPRAICAGPRPGVSGWWEVRLALPVMRSMNSKIGREYLNLDPDT